MKRVLLCLDNDAAGTGATERIGGKIRKLGSEVVEARMPGAKDPNALLLSVGSEAAAEIFRKTLAEGRARLESSSPAKTSGEIAALPLRVNPLVKEKSEATPAPDGVKVTREEGGGWRISFGTRAYRVRGLAATGLDRLKVNLRIEGAGRMHLDTLDLYGHRARAGLIKELARLFEREEEELAREIGALIETLEGIRVELVKKGEEEATHPRIEIPDREREEALRLLRSPDLVERILSDFERVGFVGEKTALTAGYLGTVSRLLEEPLGLIIVSRSGAGKSSLQDALCDFVPAEDLVKYTRLTGQALFYKEEDSLIHKVLAVDEEKGAEEAAYSIRNLQSAQVLSIAATRTDPQTGKLRTEEYRVKGPVFIVFTTTSPEALDYETRNRFVQVGIDESAEQTRRILRRQREADTLEGVLRREETSVMRRVQQNAQRLLRPLRVVNPYAPSLAYPDERLQMRREQKKYLTLIKAIALLHQHQREVKRARRGDVEVEYVEVVPSDIALANRLARQVLGRSLDELAHPTRLLLKHLVELTGKNGAGGRLFTRHEVRQATGWTDWQVRVHLRQLLDLEYVVMATGRNGKRMTYELLFEGDPEEDARYLAGLVEVEGIAAHPAKRHGQGPRLDPPDRNLQPPENPRPCGEKAHLVSETGTL